MSRWTALALLSLALLLGMSLWFGMSAVAPQVAKEWHLSPSATAWLTLAVQLGFVAGTLTSALLNLPDVFRARYLFAKREWEHWSAERDPDTARIMADSVKPVLDAGLADLVAMDHRISSEIWLEPTPGHTPGHASVRLEGGDRAAVITGDLMHHPVQVAEPEWGSHFDTDLGEARKTRRAFCERCAETGALVLGTHFHHPTAGRIVRHGETWRFAATEPR